MCLSNLRQFADPGVMDRDFLDVDTAEEASASLLMSWVGFSMVALILLAMGLSYFL